MLCDHIMQYPKVISTLNSMTSVVLQCLCRRARLCVDHHTMSSGGDCRTLPRACKLGGMVAFVSVLNLNENTMFYTTEHLLDMSITCT